MNFKGVIKNYRFDPKSDLSFKRIQVWFPFDYIQGRKDREKTPTNLHADGDIDSWAERRADSFWWKTERREKGVERLYEGDSRAFFSYHHTSSEGRQIHLLHLWEILMKIFMMEKWIIN